MHWPFWREPFAVTFLPGPWGDESVTDLFLYRSYADLFLDGLLPYRDVAFEYPPLAAPLLALPAAVGSGDDGYRLAFAALALVLAAILVLLVGGLARRTGGDPRRAMLAAAVAPLFTGAMLRTHFDLAPRGPHARSAPAARLEPATGGAGGAGGRGDDEGLPDRGAAGRLWMADGPRPA